MSKKPFPNKTVFAEPLAQNPRRAGEADFFSRYALKLSPDDPTVKQIRAEFNQAEAEQKFDEFDQAQK